MIHEDRVVDELMAWMECPFLLLEWLMMRCPCLLKLAVLSVAVVLVALIGGLLLVVSLIAAVVVDIYFCIGEWKDSPIRAIVVMPVGWLYAFSWLVAISALLCVGAVKSVLRSAWEGRLIYSV